LIGTDRPADHSAESQVELQNEIARLGHAP
jgi:hypothetical protein